MIKPIAISSTNQSLLQNLSETYTRVSRMFDVSSLWSSGANEGKEKEGVEGEEEAIKLAKAGAAGVSAGGGFPKRPGGKGGMKRMPSERPMGVKEFERVSRAEKRCVAVSCW